MLVFIFSVAADFACQTKIAHFPHNILALYLFSNKVLL